MDQERFLNLLVHHWHNLKQAQMYPSSFAYVHYHWYWEDGILKSRQWYDWNNEVYRHRQDKVRSESDKIILETYDGETRMGDSIFTESEFGFTGETEKGWIDHKGRRVEGTFKLIDELFETSDKGWDEDGNLLWGSKKGPFSFIRCTKSIPTSVISPK